MAIIPQTTWTNTVTAQVIWKQFLSLCNHIPVLVQSCLQAHVMLDTLLIHNNNCCTFKLFCY